MENRGVEGGMKVGVIFVVGSRGFSEFLGEGEEEVLFD